MVEPISQEQTEISQDKTQSEKPEQEPVEQITKAADIQASTDDAEPVEETKEGGKKKKKGKKQSKSKFFDASHSKFADNPFASIEEGQAVKRDLFENGNNQQFAEWKKMMLNKDFKEDEVKMLEK